MNFVTSEGRKDITTEKELVAEFELHRDHGDRQVILQSNEGDYLSAIGERFGPYTIEWFPAEQVGTHLKTREQLKSQEVMAVFLAFFRGGSVWRDSVPWQEVEDEGPSLLSRLFERLRSGLGGKSRRQGVGH